MNRNGLSLIEAPTTVEDTPTIVVAPKNRGRRTVNIVERRKMEPALPERETCYRTVLEAIDDSVIVKDRNGRYVVANAEALHRLGRSSEEVLSKTDLELHSPEIAATIMSYDKSVLETGLAVELEEEYRDRDFAQVCHVRKVPLRSASGEIIGVVTVSRDVSRWKRAKKALRDGKDRYRALVELSPDAIIVSTGETIVFANETAAKLMGAKRPKELIGRNLIDITHPDYREAMRALLQEPAAPGKKQPLSEERLLRLDGTEVDIEAAAITASYDGKPSRYTVLRDRTERKRIEESLRENEAWFRLLAENAKDLIFRYQLFPTVGFSYVNPAIINIVGYTPEEIYDDPESVRKIVHPDDLHLFAAVANCGALSNSVVARFIHKDGRIVCLEQRSAPVYDKAGNLVAIEGIARDVTERRVLEEQLMRAQRLETAGRIAGQVAHDFNNLLSPLVAFPDLIREELPEGHPAIQYCDSMIEAARRMADINQDLLTMGRRGRAVQKPTDLNQLVREATSGMTDRPETLDMEVHLTPNLLPIDGSPAQLLRVVVNLIANAREAMQDAGRLTIETDNVDVKGVEGRHTPVHPGQYARLSVADTGCGIPSEMQDRIFDAFFTTKNTDARRGSGLGLSVVQAIIEDHRGYMDIESEVGNGSTFRLYFPASHDTVKAELAPVCPEGTERVLVVDDDPLQRLVTSQVLTRLGYQVEIAESGEKAIDLVKEHSVDLLVLDMMMPPGIDGAETYRRVLEIQPGQKAIVLSGFAESDRVEAARALGASAYVRKPVNKQELARAVREVLGRK